MASVAPSCLTASVDAGSLSWDAAPVGFPSIFVLALGLSMDAMAVAAARGLATPHVRGRHVAQIALFFGGFQALMPLLGWMIGASLGEHVRAWDHWIAFVLLCAIGLKMLWDARPGAPEPDEEAAPSDAFAPRVLLVLAHRGGRPIAGALNHWDGEVVGATTWTDKISSRVLTLVGSPTQGVVKTIFTKSAGQVAYITDSMGVRMEGGLSGDGPRKTFQESLIAAGYAASADGKFATPANATKCMRHSIQWS
jgi:hypothetical protein